VTVAWGKTRGADCVAIRGEDRWIIEAKGCWSRRAMRVNYFLAILAETLQRMDDPQTRYSIALPDLAQFRGLWQRPPDLAKERTSLTALFVDLMDICKPRSDTKSGEHCGSWMLEFAPTLGCWG
jgi:hypothetical protein